MREMENECYSVWTAGDPDYFLGVVWNGGAGVGRRPWHGPLLLAGGWLAGGKRGSG